MGKGQIKTGSLISCHQLLQGARTSKTGRTRPRVSDTLPPAAVAASVSVFDILCPYASGLSIFYWFSHLKTGCCLSTYILYWFGTRWNRAENEWPKRLVLLEPTVKPILFCRISVFSDRILASNSALCIPRLVFFAHFLSEHRKKRRIFHSFFEPKTPKEIKKEPVTCFYTSDRLIHYGRYSIVRSFSESLIY